MTTYNRFIIIIISFFWTNIVFSQMSPVWIQLAVDNNPPSEISEWVNQPGLATFIVTNSDPALEDVEYTIKVDMYLDGDLVVTTNNSVAIQSLTIGSQVFLAEDIIPGSALEFPSQSFQNNLTQTGMLPAGNYEFCVSVESVFGDFITQPDDKCENMFITDYQMPELILPLPNQQVNSTLLPTTIFTWSPMIPSPPATLGLKYILSVYEVQDGQVPYQAFLNNLPIIEEEVFGTQFSWPPFIVSTGEQIQYIWSVKPVNLNNDPYLSSGNGFVVPETFTVVPMMGEQQNNSLDTLCDCVDVQSQFITSIQPFLTQQITSASIPELTISQPEPVLYPRKIELSGVVDIRDALFDCITPTTESVVISSVDINWDTATTETTMNNGPFEHEYGVGEQIPDFITVTYKIENIPYHPEFLCEKVAWAPMPQSILDLNNIDNSGNINVGDTFFVGEVINGNGEFECVVDTVNTVNNTYSGTGTVQVPWLGVRMAVEFNNITLDSSLNLSSGEVVVQSYPTAPDTTQIGSVYVGAVSDFINNYGSYATPMQTVDGALSAVNYIITPKKMPFGVQSSQGDELILTKMVFYNNRSEHDLVAVKHTSPKFQSQNIGFKATNVKFSLINPISVPERIELVEDVLIGNTNSDIYFYFLAPSSSNTGCYIDLDENGIQQFGIELSAKFTRDWFIPLPDDGVSRSTASLSTVATNWDDLILTGIFEESEIVDANGITVLASNMSMDMSDAMNPSSITFPSNYVGETTNLFTGFYMEELTVQLPDSLWKTPDDEPVQISATNMIIDNTGMTVMIDVTNVALFDSIAVSDLSCSIDLVNIEIQSSSLVEASIEGQIGLPLSNSSTIQNPLNYEGLFHHTQGPLDVNSIQLTIQPAGPVFSDFFKGTLCFSQNSSIVAYADDNNVQSFNMELHGALYYSNVSLGNSTIDIGLSFNNLNMSNHSVDGFSFNTPPATFGGLLGSGNFNNFSGSPCP